MNFDKIIGGVLLILIGLWIGFREYIPLDIELWPTLGGVALILFGLKLLAESAKGKSDQSSGKAS